MMKILGPEKENKNQADYLIDHNSQIQWWMNWLIKFTITLIQLYLSLIAVYQINKIKNKL